MTEPKAKAEPVDVAIRDQAPSDGAYLTGWVVVAEWMDRTGDGLWLTVRDSGIPIWKRDGMLSHAQDAVPEEDEDAGT